MSKETRENKTKLSSSLKNLIEVNPQVEAKYCAELILPQVEELERVIDLLENMPDGSQIRKRGKNDWECDKQDARGSWEDEGRGTSAIEVLEILRKAAAEDQQEGES